jgi:hypothetical protein
MLKGYHPNMVTIYYALRALKMGLDPVGMSFDQLRAAVASETRKLKDIQEPNAGQVVKVKQKMSGNFSRSDATFFSIVKTYMKNGKFKELNFQMDDDDKMGIMALKEELIRDEL